ncbi:hypothetical protein PTSG_04911 [Salpingoeca rosetta]|uniref:Uncharacterized protein n=1 Tax=Salpingoeca rosetta (strain ATCC 50818 / BSB-021) TaxID=946362 RepID=F2U8Z4_SALR5|nr:uncharacterized protein PTSG_04911 [Salpingoeca rosetta]EGD73197.1 hypothetical protein PTSG_04911 [Salpingoeca rosetta]|eukprot:XP_004994228.1 hypothetical protein PTSG_04911 [Salpingoeca rosetta]
MMTTKKTQRHTSVCTLDVTGEGETLPMDVEQVCQWLTDVREYDKAHKAHKSWPPFVPADATVLLKQAEALLAHGTDPKLRQRDAITFLDAATVTFEFALSIVTSTESSLRKYGISDLTDVPAIEGIIQSALGLFRVNWSGETLKDSAVLLLFAAQLLRLSFAQPYKRLLRGKQEELAREIVQAVLPSFLELAQDIEPGTNDAHLNAITRPFKLNKSHVQPMLFACLLEVLTLLLIDPKSDDSLHGPTMAELLETTRCSNDVDMALKCIVGTREVLSVIEPCLWHDEKPARQERCVRFLSALFADWSPDEADHLATISEPLIPGILACVASRNERLVHAAAVCLKHLVFRMPRIQQHVLQHDAPRVLAQAISDPCESAKVGCTIALLHALINCVFDMDSHTWVDTITESICSVTQHCSKTRDLLRVAAIATVSIEWVSRQLADNPSERAHASQQEHVRYSLCCLISALSNRVFKPLADDRRQHYDIRRNRNALWPMSLIPDADTFAARVFAAVSVTQESLDAWTGMYWLGEPSDGTVPSTLLHRLCQCGLEPMHVQRLLRDGVHAHLPLEKEAATVEFVVAELLVYVQQLAETHIPTMEIVMHTRGAMGWALRRRFWQWLQKWQKDEDALLGGMAAVSYPTLEEARSWLQEFVSVSASVPFNTPTADCQNPGVYEKLKTAVDTRTQQELSLTLGTQLKQEREVVVALSHRRLPHSRTGNKVLLTAGKATPPAGMTRWYHGCAGFQALQILQHGTVSKGTTAHAHDLGLSPSFYLHEQFSCAAQQAEARAQSGKGVGLLERSPAVLVFDIPEDELRQFNFLIVDNKQQSKCCLFASHNAESILQNLADSDDDVDALRDHVRQMANEVWRMRTRISIVRGEDSGDDDGDDDDDDDVDDDDDEDGGANPYRSRLTHSCDITKDELEQFGSGGRDDLKRQLERVTRWLAHSLDEFDWVFSHASKTPHRRLDKIALREEWGRGQTDTWAAKYLEGPRKRNTAVGQLAVKSKKRVLDFISHHLTAVLVFADDLAVKSIEDVERRQAEGWQHKEKKRANAVRKMIERQNAELKQQRREEMAKKREECSEKQQAAQPRPSAVDAQKEKRESVKTEADAQEWVQVEVVRRGKAKAQAEPRKNAKKKAEKKNKNQKKKQSKAAAEDQSNDTNQPRRTKKKVICRW